MNNLFNGKRIESILQHEASECGLAATAMILRYHGHKIDLAFMRALRPVSRVGLTFSDIVDICDRMGFDARGYALGSLEDLHAWVEVEGQVLIGALDQPFHPLIRFG